MSIHHLQKFKDLPGIDQGGKEVFETDHDDIHEDISTALQMRTPPSSPLLRKIRHRRGIPATSPSLFNQERWVDKEEHDSDLWSISTPKGSRFSPKFSDGDKTEGLEETTVYPMNAFQYFEKNLVFRPGKSKKMQVPGVLDGQYELEVLRQPRSSEEQSDVESKERCSRVRETPLQKFKRLQIEIEEFANEINNMQDRVNADDNQVDHFVEQSVRYSDLGEEVNRLQSALNNLEQSRILQIMINPSTAVENLLEHQESLTQELGDQLKTFVETSRYQVADTVDETGNQGETSPQRIVYELYSIPDREKLDQVVKYMRMEKRIVAIEHLIGIPALDPEVYKDGSNICDTVAQLEKQMSLLDHRTINVLQKKLETTNAELDKLMKWDSSDQHTGDFHKINQLYDKVQQWDTHVESIPLLIDRLASLKRVHDDAIISSNCIEKMQQQQSDIQRLLDDEDNLLKQLTTSFQENMTIAEKNIRQMDERMSMLMNKIKLLDEED